MAHGIPYVATASVADLHDLEAKVLSAMELHGSRYIHVHVPCPLGWGSDPALTISVARLAIESGLFPIFESRRGEITSVHKIRRRVPVEEYLRLQKRFNHLFQPVRNTEVIKFIQTIADRNIANYGLDKSNAAFDWDSSEVAAE